MEFRIFIIFIGFLTILNNSLYPISSFFNDIVGKASSALQSFGPEDYRRKGSKNRKLLRVAGGQTWEDPTLSDWSDDDFRMFCGDLGNDVTDELLTRTFNKYPSFLRARVIRDKRTNKSKGYGFISFKDPADFTKAMKEMNGK